MSKKDDLPFPTAQSMRDHPPVKTVQEHSGARTEQHAPTEAKLDHAVEESFPASDPVSASVTRVVQPRSDEGAAAGDAPATGGHDKPAPPR